MRKVASFLLFIAIYSWVLLPQLDAQDFWQATNITMPSMPFGNPAGFYVGIGTRIFRSADNGITWDSLFVTASRMNDLVWAGGQTLLVPTEGSGVYRSTNGGIAWSVVGDLPPFVRHVIVGAGDYVYAGTRDSGVYLSTNSGLTWSRSWDGMTEQNISGLAMASNGTLLAAVKGANGIYQSVDNGAHWTGTGMTLSYRVCSLLACPNGHVFAGTAEVANGIYQSTDNGTTWAPWALAGQGMGSYPGITVGNTIFWPTGTIGVARFVNENSNLDTVNSGLTNRAILGLAYWNGYLYLGTQYGLFRTTGTIAGVNTHIEESPREFGLFQNYPNPFNPVCRISYRLPDESRVRLTISNVLGQDVRTLVNTIEQPGDKAVQFDATGLQGGIFFYRLDAMSISDPTKHFSQTRKMLLVK